ncbi:chlorophyllase [Actinomycetospora sp. OC33-EN07]|uniref:Chlorophyllase n=1 Tax=Actinomycetospora flava TaxID=3129232 RepID=A0ABU8M2K8_9PSEU
MSVPVVSVSPVEMGERSVRVSAPVSGSGLPVLLFSHGFGSSSRAYGPLVDHWAGHGFVVVQPTHLDSRTLGLPDDDPRRRTFWRHRVDDMTRVLDGLDVVEAAVPGLAGRVDRDRVVAAGHSFGGQTVGVLLGLRVEGEDLADPRVTAGVLLATAGRGGDDLRPGVIEMFPWLDPDFSAMKAPALVVMGDADASALSTRGPDWSADPYRLSPPGKSLLTLVGAEHSLGGIPGYEAAETTDEDPARVAALQRLTTAYLRSALDPADAAWSEAAATVPAAIGRVESR